MICLGGQLNKDKAYFYADPNTKFLNLGLRLVLTEQAFFLH